MGTLYRIGSNQSDADESGSNRTTIVLAGLAVLLVAGGTVLAVFEFRKSPTSQAARPQAAVPRIPSGQPPTPHIPTPPFPASATRPVAPTPAFQPAPAHPPVAAQPLNPAATAPGSGTSPQDMPPATGYGQSSAAPTPSGPAPGQAAARQLLTAVRATLSDYVVGKAEHDIATTKLDTIQQLGQLPGPEMERAFAGQRSGLAKQKAAVERMVQLAQDQSVAPALRDRALAVALGVQRGDVSAEAGIAELDRMLAQLSAPTSQSVPQNTNGFQPGAVPRPQGRARLGNVNIRVVNDGRGREQAIGRVLIINEGPYDITDFRLSLKVNGLAYVLAPYEGTVALPRPILSRRLRSGQTLDVPVMTTGTYWSFSVYGVKGIILEASLDGPPGTVTHEADVM